MLFDDATIMSDPVSLYIRMLCGFQHVVPHLIRLHVELLHSIKLFLSLSRVDGAEKGVKKSLSS